MFYRSQEISIFVKPHRFYFETGWREMLFAADRHVLFNLQLLQLLLAMFKVGVFVFCICEVLKTSVNSIFSESIVKRFWLKLICLEVEILSKV